MKRLFLMMVILSSSAWCATESQTPAETKNESKTTYGVQIGVTTSNANVSPSVTSNSMTGLTAGVTAEVPVWEHTFFVQPELNYSQRGAENTSFAGRSNTRLDYLELPVQAKARFEAFGVKPYLLAGPKLSYLLSASSTGGTAVDRGQLRNVDFALDFGAGAGCRVGEKTDMYLTAKYSLGLTNVNTTSGAWDTSGSAWNNRGFQVIAGLFF